jgi:hypothetical protein
MQSTSRFCFLDLPLREQFHVLGDSVEDKVTVVVSWVVVMQSALMLAKLHVWQARLLSVDKECFIVAVICDAALLGHVAQSNNIGDGSFTEPNALAIAQCVCLAGHQHRSTIIASESHGGPALERSVNQLIIAERICCRLVVQEHDLPEVELLENVSLLEELLDLWLEL